MPLNCPIDYGADRTCEDCMWLCDGLCWAKPPARPISEIMNNEERLSKLETQSYTVKASPVSRNEFDQIKGRMIHLENKLNTLTDKKKKKYYKYIS